VIVYVTNFVSLIRKQTKMEAAITALPNELDELTTTLTKVEISDETRAKLLNLEDEECQVTVHCKIAAPFFDTVARIWETTYLVDNKSKHKSILLHINGVTRYPIWTEIPKGTTLNFTLIFSKLPVGCQSFDFLEEIPEPGGFYVGKIKRNTIDVYHIELS